MIGNWINANKDSFKDVRGEKLINSSLVTVSTDQDS